MTIDDMKNKISMKLGGTDAQLGFEVICKKLAELEKENTELKAQISKYEETIDIEQDLNKDAAGEIELYQQENAELKQKLESDQLALNEATEIIAELKAQIIDIKEDVEKERNKQRRLENDFTTDVLNSLLQKWKLAE